MISLVYDKQPTKVLQAVLRGFERDFDTVSTNKIEAQYRPSADWLSRRMSTIRSILDGRDEQIAKMPRHVRTAQEQIEAGIGQPVRRWNR